jgi:hypothetical protein
VGYNTNVHGNVTMKLFIAIGEQEGQTGSCLGVGTGGSGEDIRKGTGGDCGGHTVHSCMEIEK